MNIARSPTTTFVKYVCDPRGEGRPPRGQVTQEYAIVKEYIELEIRFKIFLNILYEEGSFCEE